MYPVLARQTSLSCAMSQSPARLSAKSEPHLFAMA